MGNGEDDLSRHLIERLAIHGQAKALLTAEENQAIESYYQKLDDLEEEYKTSLTSELEENLSVMALESVPGSKEALDKMGKIEDMLESQANKNDKLQ
jgi:hypothetical protein